MTEKWNDGQLQVIKNTTGNMIVSASAGSGKTATMIERVKRLILDKKVPVSRILMLSFNEAIASEIKEKMAKALIEEVKTSDNKEFLREQIDALGMADITTMHSFCNSLIKEYFDLVGVDPAYGVMDESESNVVINKSINEIFDDYFERNDSDFMILKDKLSQNGDDKLREAVVGIFKFSNSLINSDEWLDNAVLSNYNVPLDRTKEAKYLLKDIINKVNNAYDAIEDACNFLDEEKYPELSEMLEHIKGYQDEENIISYESFEKGKVNIPIRRFTDKESKEYYNNAKNTYKLLLTTIASLFPKPYLDMKADVESDGVMLRKLINIVKQFKTKYTKEKADVNKLDFNDMEHYAVEILSHENILAQIKARYDYVCVDEYQDTNEVQDKVLSSVSKGDNLFMVGDPKQSIYKFRFTEPELFVDKLKKYEKSDCDNVVELDKNYRSSPLILKKINEVFDILMQRPNAGMIRNAYSSLDNGLDFEDNIKKPFEVMLYEMPSREKEKIVKPSVYKISEDYGDDDTRIDAKIEADYIAGKINELKLSKIYDVKSNEYRDVKFDDMVILAQSRNANVKEILEILEKEYKVPIDATYLKKKDEPQEVKILLDFLRCVDNPRQDIVLYTVMKMFFDFTDSEFVAMRSEAGSIDYFHKIVFDGHIKSEPLCSKINNFITKLNEYRLLSSFMNVHDFLMNAVLKLDFKSKLLMSHNGKIAIDNIDKFLVTLKDQKHCSTVQEFLYAYDNYNIVNDIESTSETIKDCVHTSTIHQSKGLEYPIVFIVSAGTSFVKNSGGQPDFVMDKDFGIALRTFNDKNKTVYSNWLVKGISMKKLQEETEERLRLLYVAMTRAKNCLYIVGKVPKDKTNIEEKHSFSSWLYYIADKNPDFNACVNCQTYDDVDNILLSSYEKKVRAFNYEKYTNEDENRYSKVFDYVYPHMEATRLAEKYTVTSINHEEREKEEYVSELYETEKTSVGSIYHKFMEHVNYEADTIDAIQCEMQRMVEEKILTDEEIANIVIDDVYKCLNSPIIKTAKLNRHEREKKFMMHIPLSQVKDGASDEKVIIQGIADLVIYGKENILVDFKKSTLPDHMLKENYQKQLDIYKFALESSMDIKIDKMYLYVIGRDAIIDMKH